MYRNSHKCDELLILLSKFSKNVLIFQGWTAIPGLKVLFSWSVSTCTFTIFQFHREVQYLDMVLFITFSRVEHDVFLSFQNVLLESIELFKTVCNTKQLCEPLLFLFLSKKDLFEEKLKTTPLSVCFPDYTGASCLHTLIPKLLSVYLTMNNMYFISSLRINS